MMGGRLALMIDAVDAGAGRAQFPGQGNIVSLDSDDERRASLAVGHIRIGAGFDQNFQQVSAPLALRTLLQGDQERGTLIVSSVAVCARLQQQTYLFRMASAGGA